MSDEPTYIRQSGSGAGWFVGIVLLCALIAGIFAFSQYDSANSAKDRAVAGAANHAANHDLGTAPGPVKPADSAVR